MADLKLYDIIDMTPLIDYLRLHGELRRYRRRELFTRIDSVTPEMGLVVSGGFSFSHHDYKGVDQILSFALPGEILGAYISPSNTRRSGYDVTALCDSEVLVVPREEVIDYLDKEHAGFRLDFTTAIAISFMQRATTFRCDSPEARYSELLERLPGIDSKISMTAIASYLGITRETFARLRKKLRDKK